MCVLMNMIKIINNDYESGQSLVEILIATTIVTMVLVAVASSSIASVRNSHFARNNALATRFAQEGHEWARAQRDMLGWNDFSSTIGTGTAVYCLIDPTVDLGSLTPGNCGSEDKITGTIFLREVSFVYVPPVPPPSPEEEYYRVITETEWEDNSGEHTATAETILSKWMDL